MHQSCCEQLGVLQAGYAPCSRAKLTTRQAKTLFSTFCNQKLEGKVPERMRSAGTSIGSCRFVGQMPSTGHPLGGAMAANSLTFHRGKYASFRMCSGNDRWTMVSPSIWTLAELATVRVNGSSRLTGGICPAI